MPELIFTVRWPDGREDDCYSPSLVMHDHLVAGATYSVADFVRRADAGLHEAAMRVQSRFGFFCTASAASADRIRATAATYPADAAVRVLALHPPLPQEA